MMDGDTIRTLTEAYVKAFDARDLDAVEALLDVNFSLTDPQVTNLTPRGKVLAFMADLFKASDVFSFVARNILVDGSRSAIEFELVIGDKRLAGVDVIEWRDGRMTALRAHLTELA